MRCAACESSSQVAAADLCWLAADFTGDSYLRILEAAKAGAPDIHVHAFSPLEVCCPCVGDAPRRARPQGRWTEPASGVAARADVRALAQVTQGAATLGWPLADFLRALKDAGLGSLPGTAAEVLHDDVRQALCPDKIDTAQWLNVSPSTFGAVLQQRERNW